MRLALLFASALAGSYACYDYSLGADDRVTQNDAGTDERQSFTPNLPLAPPIVDAGEEPAELPPLEAGNGCKRELVCAVDLLTRCRKHADGLETVAKCANGCITHPDADDECSAPSPCKPGALYCGGNKINGNPNVVYACDDGGLTATPKALCPNGCMIQAPANDRCK